MEEWILLLAEKTAMIFMSYRSEFDMNVIFELPFRYEIMCWIVCSRNCRAGIE